MRHAPGAKAVGPIRITPSVRAITFQKFINESTGLPDPLNNTTAGAGSARPAPSGTKIR
jgi:hypothetical protein